MREAWHIFFGYFSRGGYLMLPIFAVSIVAWWLGINKLVYFQKFSMWRKAYLRQVSEYSRGKFEEPKTGNESYDVLLRNLQSRLRCERGSCSGVLLFREFLIGAIPEIERGFSTMSAWIAVAPLLGLLGTVMGMIDTFKVITDYGLGNPNLMAQGISIALITTQAGLTVAFPMMLFHNALVGRSRKIVNRLMLDGEDLVNELRKRSGRLSGEKE